MLLNISTYEIAIVRFKNVCMSSSEETKRVNVSFMNIQCRKTYLLTFAFAFYALCMPSEGNRKIKCLIYDHK